MKRDDDEVSTVALAVAGRAPAWHVRRLTVLEGTDAGASFLLDPNSPTRLLLGTSPACQLRVSDRTVSRRHASLEPIAGGCRVVDLGSTNGTSVAGVMISDARLAAGQILRVGDTTMRLEVDVAGEAAPLPASDRFGRVIGASNAMRRLYPLCLRLAASRVPLVIEGETGTGKENLAESIHEAQSPNAPFVVFDCTAVSATLVEAELFGHERGAFTGAVASRPGVFEQASGGTILIDEIGDLELGLQAKLLRVIERGELRRVGGQKPIRVDVRVIAATRRNLDKEVAAGRFRDDLFHRLAIARIELPPLRERHGDVELLARTFAESLTGSADALPDTWLGRYADYPWPGNVRELRNAVIRLVALGEDAVAEQGAPPSIAPQATSAGSAEWVSAFIRERVPFPIARRRVLEDFERRYTEAILAEHGGHVGRAAEASGLALRYFQLVKARARQG